MSTAQKKAALMKLYGPSWAGKVDKMSDSQIHAIYASKLNADEFNK